MYKWKRWTEKNFLNEKIRKIVGLRERKKIVKMSVQCVNSELADSFNFLKTVL